MHPHNNLSRLFSPKSIAVFGGSWAQNVITQLQESGFVGDIWPVHPTRDETCGLACYKNIADLPAPPDASFIGVNRELTIEIVRTLSAMGAGGATCFASGFLESEKEKSGGADLQRELITAAGDMPILGPNCYGLINYLDNATLWPDQHGGKPVDKGVALIGQSSNVLINLTMQKRNLPIGFVAAAGNCAQTDAWQIADHLLDDPRITAIGFFLEGLGNIRQMEKTAAKARTLGKSLVVLKTGRSDAARRNALTHSASMSGSADFSSALFARLGMVEVDALEVLLETLKLSHFHGTLESNSVISISCSGGEAGLVSDTAIGTSIDFKPFSLSTAHTLKDLLGPIVTINNPLDYHTFIWGDTPRMTDVFATAMADKHELCLFVLDIPRSDRCNTQDFQCAIDAILAAQEKTGAKVAVVGSLPENLEEAIAEEFNSAGIATLNGLEAAVKAIDGSIRAGQMGVRANPAQSLTFSAVGSQPNVLSEADSKAYLSRYGLSVPRNVSATTINEAVEEAQQQLQLPVALKVLGISHKSDSGGVVLGLNTMEEIADVASNLPPGDGFLIEEMITNPLVELIVGISRESSGLSMLTIGAGGIHTEVMQDKVNLLLPVNAGEIKEALQRLRIWPLLTGHRGRPGVDIDATVDAILAITRADGDVEIDVNPLILRENDAIAADALVVVYD